MNVDTGEIKYFKTAEDAKKASGDCKLVPIDIKDATEKQEKDMWVSLHDSKSKLGKLRIQTKNGNKRKKTRRSKRGSVRIISSL